MRAWYCSMPGAPRGGAVTQVPKLRWQKNMREVLTRLRTKIMVILLALAISMPMLAVPSVLAGNGSPSGQHFNLNIIGVPNEKNENFDGGEGSRIFVLRTGTTFFYVHGGDSYEILDHDGTDGYVGSSREDPGLILPYDETSDEWLVQIYVRLLGPKDSSVKWKSYYWDGDEYIKFAEFTINRERPPKFSLKTGQLLADGYQDILWEMYDKTDFRLLQMRIYLEPA